MKLSIIIPAFNEQATIAEVIRRAQKIPAEIIVIDDGSTDGTFEAAKTTDPFLVARVTHEGQGAAIREGLRYATGEHICVLDADGELSPEDIPALLARAQAGAWVVTGVRPNLGLGNHLITLWANLLFGGLLKDLCCGLTIIRADLLRMLCLKENGFGFQCELTAKLLRGGYQIVEVPISYTRRTRAQGKKLRWYHGLQCAWLLLRMA
jgi:glycosyltransferase involved in cell wall biosynthesis